MERTLYIPSSYAFQIVYTYTYNGKKKDVLIYELSNIICMHNEEKKEKICVHLLFIRIIDCLQLMHIERKKVYLVIVMRVVVYFPIYMFYLYLDWKQILSSFEIQVDDMCPLHPCVNG